MKPKPLYHYTSAAALDTIFTIKKSVDRIDQRDNRTNVLGLPIETFRPGPVILYATHLNYFNDTSEFLLGVDTCIKILKKPNTKICEALKEKLLERFERTLKYGSNSDIYITCFSSAIDQVDLWRGYSEEHSGVAIGLGKCGLERMSGWYENVSFMECIYEQNAQEKVLTETLNSSVKKALIAADKSEGEDKRMIKLVNTVSTLLESDIVRMKSDAFENEREWRMIFRNPIRALNKQSEIDSQGEKNYHHLHPANSGKKRFITDCEFRSGRYGLTDLPQLHRTPS
jgi:hypothetical protein